MLECIDIVTNREFLHNQADFGLHQNKDSQNNLVIALVDSFISLRVDELLGIDCQTQWSIGYQA